MGEGGATGGTWSWDPGPPPWVRGSIYKKKVLRDPGPNTHTTATIRKEVLKFLQSLALLRAVHNPCQRREMTISTNNGLVNGAVHNLPMQFFTP